MSLRYWPDVAWENLAVEEIRRARTDHQALAQQITPDIARRAADISFAHPTLTGGQVAGAAIAQFDPLGPEVGQMVQLESDRLARLRKPNIVDPVETADSGWRKIVRRWILNPLQSAYDEVVKGTTAVGVGLVQGKDLTGALRGGYGGSISQLDYSLSKMGYRTDPGEGLFGESRLLPETEELLRQGVDFYEAIQNPAQLEHGIPLTQLSRYWQSDPDVSTTIATPTGENLAISPGRAVAATVLEPGSRPFSLASGFVDAGSNIFLDPANKIGGLVGDLKAANRMLIPDGVRPTVLQRGMDDWLGSGHGQRVTQFLADSDDFLTNYELLSTANRTRAGVANAGLARQITESTDPGEIAELLRAEARSGNLTQIIGRQSLVGRATGTAGLGGIAGAAAGSDLAAVAGLRRVVGRAQSDGLLGRWTAQIGSRHLDPQNIDQATFQLGEWMKVAGADTDEMSTVLRQMAELEPGDYDGVFRVARDAQLGLVRRLGDTLPSNVVVGARKVFDDTERMRAYFNDALGQPVPFPGSKFRLSVDGDIIEAPSAHEIAELLNSQVPLLDYQRVRSATRRASAARWLGDEAALRRMSASIERWDDFGPGGLTRAANYLMGLWKPMVLLRPAWLLRVVGEEQVRMAAGGLDSAASHPIHWLAIATGRRASQDVLGETFTEALEGEGANFISRWYRTQWEHHSDEFAGAMSRRGGALGGRGGRGRHVVGDEYITLQKGQERHLEGWALDIRKQSNDPVASAIAGRVIEEGDVGTALDAIKRDFRNPESRLGQLRQKLIADGERFDIGLSSDRGADAYIDSVWARVAQTTGGTFEYFDPAALAWRSNRRRDPTELITGGRQPNVGGRKIEGRGAGAAAWVHDSVQYRNIEVGSPDVLGWIATGRVDDQLKLRFAGPETPSEVADLSRIVNKITKDGYDTWAPQSVTVPRQLSEERVRMLNTVVDASFDLLMSRPSNYLSRSPAFKQIYWKRVSELLPQMDGPTQAAVLRAAREAGFSRKELRGMAGRMLGAEDSITRVVGSDFTNLEDVDVLAKALALEETKGLLYDVSNTTNFFDITRNIFPFGEAWAEIITTWTKLVADNPGLIRRFQQGIEGTRAAGIFHQDERGQEVFSMPAQSFVGDLIGFTSDSELEAGPTFQAPASGLNLALNSYLPGVGPMVQLPFAVLGGNLATAPEFAWLQNFINPFGQPDIGSPGALVDTVSPAWVRKAAVALFDPDGNDERLFNNTVVDTLKAMQVNGDVDLTDPESVRAMLPVAQRRARYIYAIRAASQFIGPVGAQVQWDLENDETGEEWAFQALSTAYYELKEQLGSEKAAFEEFIRRFGVDPATFVVGKTIEVVPRSDTEEGLAFQRANPELFERMPLTAYYAAPDEPGAEFNYQAYMNQLREGTREALTPDEWMRKRNQLLGRVAYDQLRAEIAALPEAAQNDEMVQAYRRAYKIQLAEQYPGYGFDNAGVAAGADPDEVRAEFEQWLNEPALLETDAGQGLALFLDARRQVEEAAAAMDVVSWQTAEKAEPLRRWLYQYAVGTVGPQHPDFVVIFDRWFRSEVEDPIVPQVDPSSLQLPGMELFGEGDDG